MKTFLGGTVVATPESLVQPHSSACAYVVKSAPANGARIRIVRGITAKAQYASVARKGDVPVANLGQNAAWYGPLSVIHVLDGELYLSIQLQTPNRSADERRQRAAEMARAALRQLTQP